MVLTGSSVKLLRTPSIAVCSWCCKDAIDNITTKVDLLKYCHDHDIKVCPWCPFQPAKVLTQFLGLLLYGGRSEMWSHPSTNQWYIIHHLRSFGTVGTKAASSARCFFWNTCGLFDGGSRRCEATTSTWGRVPERWCQGTRGVWWFQSQDITCPWFVHLLIQLYHSTTNHALVGPLPSIFGLHIATYILCELAEKPISNPLPIKNRRKLYERMLRDLLHREQIFTGKIIKYVLFYPLPRQVCWIALTVNSRLTKMTLHLYLKTSIVDARLSLLMTYPLDLFSSDGTPKCLWLPKTALWWSTLMLRNTQWIASESAVLTKEQSTVFDRGLPTFGAQKLRWLWRDERKKWPGIGNGSCRTFCAWYHQILLFVLVKHYSAVKSSITKRYRQPNDVTITKEWITADGCH